MPLTKTATRKLTSTPRSDWSRPRHLGNPAKKKCCRVGLARFFANGNRTARVFSLYIFGRIFSRLNICLNLSFSPRPAGRGMGRTFRPTPRIGPRLPSLIKYVAGSAKTSPKWGLLRSTANFAMKFHRSPVCDFLLWYQISFRESFDLRDALAIARGVPSTRSFEPVSTRAARTITPLESARSSGTRGYVPGHSLGNFWLTQPYSEIS